MMRQGDPPGSKRSLGIPRLSSCSFFPLPAGPSRGARSQCVGLDVPGEDSGYIMQLVADVRQFADMLVRLKDAFQYQGSQDYLPQLVQERLGDLLRVLKDVISKHQALNSVDILSAAGTVIAKVKGINFMEKNEDSKKKLFGDVYSSIDAFAVTFGNVVSDFLMGDVDKGSVSGLSQTPKSQSFENLSAESGGSSPEKDDLPGRPGAQQPDGALRESDSGVESALLYAKAWSKYTKDVLCWVEKRLNLDIECAKGFAKMAESAKSLTSQQEYMPFQEIYMSAFKNDIEYSQFLFQTAAALQTNKFMQPLISRKSDLDKLRKEVKEQWQREQKKMHDAESALKKAKLLQAQRQEEYERARCSTSRAEEEQLGSGGKQLEKRRRLEEEAQVKAGEASEQFKACRVDVELKRVDLAKAKSEILTQIRELVFQCDLTLKAVTVNWFQMHNTLAVSLPVNYQSLCESAKLYEPGQRYTEFIRSLPREQSHSEAFSFDISGSPLAWLPQSKRGMISTHSSHGNLSQMSAISGDFHTTDELDCLGHTQTVRIGERRSHSSTDIQALRIQVPFRAWSTSSQGGGMCSDSESAGGSSESRSMDSPTASPGDFKRRLPRTPSTGTMSSADDLDEREPPSPSDNGLSEILIETTSSPGPFRNALMSKAAQTHKLRKLRSPSKCRECDSLVVFHGAECEECSLACHKKCLETLAIQCGHKKLQGRLHLFGIDFTQAARNNPDGIPFIIRKCTSEIENRALNIKGIYRVNGAKSRVEKLCQAFENGKDLVELSELYPHDISNVLKLYLRQLPEPLILFRYYNDFIGLAKESQGVIAEELEKARKVISPQQNNVSMELNRVLFKMKDLLRQLPPPHYKTLQFLIGHLHRVTEKADENKMTASNLGIIFGPTLIKPRQSDADVSLSSLVDYPYQALIVELLIRHYEKIFDTPLSTIPEPPLQALKGLQLCVSAKEKEQLLSRHSRSLVDIKEESTKVYKRHTSVIPSIQLLEEVKGVTADPANTPEDFISSTREEEAEEQVPAHSQLKTPLRPARCKPPSRPVSVPQERPASQTQSNRSYRNTIGCERSPTIEEVTEPDKAGSRRTCIDTQTLRRTWDKQYKQYSSTPRTTVIMANTECEATTPNQMPPAEGSPVPVNSSKPPRTLQPPPGFFYKPPTSSKAKLPIEEPIQGVEQEGSAGGDSEQEEQKPKATLVRSESAGSSVEEQSPSEAKRVIQRLRPRRLQELEHREAHFV